MDSNRTNWKDAFSFFYWGIQDKTEKKHPGAADQVNTLIQMFLLRNESNDPMSWDALLRDLMIFVHENLASDFMPENEKHEWLNRAASKIAEPHVSWSQLNQHRNTTAAIPDIVAHIQTVAYHAIETRSSWTLNTAWYSNPFLVDFQNSQNFGPWEVALPLQLDQTELPGQRDLEVVFRKIKDRTFPSLKMYFGISINIRLNKAVLTWGSASQHVGIQAVDLAKRLYTGMLLCADDMSHAKDTVSLHGVLWHQFGKWEQYDTLSANKELWDAMKLLEQTSPLESPWRPIKPVVKYATDSTGSPTKRSRRL